MRASAAKTPALRTESSRPDNSRSEASRSQTSRSQTSRSEARRKEGGPSEVREVMDIRQASGYLGISSDTLYKYASEGFVPAFKLGNRWRFKKSRLDDWMNHQSDASMAHPEVVTLPARQKKPVRPAR